MFFPQVVSAVIENNRAVCRTLDLPWLLLPSNQKSLQNHLLCTKGETIEYQTNYDHMCTCINGKWILVSIDKTLTLVQFQNVEKHFLSARGTSLDKYSKLNFPTLPFTFSYEMDNNL